MFQVSDAFKLAALQPVQIHRIAGTIGNVSFSENNIVDGSFSINNQSTDTSDVVLGSCYVGQLTAEFTGISGISYGNWINKTITPTFGLKVGNDWENVPLGVFKIKEAKHTERGVQVTAYDNMIKFDKKFKKSHFMNLSGMYNIISQLCTDSGVILGMTQAQIEALPNGDRTGINIYGSKGKKSEFANDITTNRDLLFWVAQTLGCFATMNRAGQLEFRQYTQNVVDIISNNYRIEGATFADYVTHYIGIYVENLDDNTEDYYGYDTTALTAELNETSAEISADNDDITDLQADLVTWQQKYENHECTYEEYLAAVTEINADITAKRNDIKQLNKRLAWLEKALQSGGDDGSDMVLGANPLCMAANKTTRDQQRREILGALNDISYTPFTASVVCGCIYDLGDVIQFSGGLYNSENDSFGCVMSYTYTHNGGTELEGFGVDPSIVVVRNKTQKSVDRASKNSVDAPKSLIGTVDPNTGGGGGGGTPTPIEGKSGDIYMQTSAEVIEDMDDITALVVISPIKLLLFGKNPDGSFTMRVGGYPSSVWGEDDAVVLEMKSVTTGVVYDYSFRAKFNDGAHFDGNNNKIRIGLNYPDGIQLYNDSDEHLYEGSVTPINNRFVIHLMSSRDGEYTELWIYDLKITPQSNKTQGTYINNNGVWQKTMPTASNDIVGGVKVGENLTISDQGVLNANVMTGAGSSTAGSNGLVPAPASGDNDKYLKGDGTWGAVSGGGNVDDVKVDGTSVVTNKIANINTMTGADGTNAGAKGLVPAPTATDNQKYLRGDGTWQTVSGGGSAEMLAPTPFIYSETEEQVGIWTDGKPLYQKIYYFNSALLLNSNTWTNTTISNSTIERIVDVRGFNNLGAIYDFIAANRDSGSYVQILQTRNSAISVNGIILQYTKTTDTAWQGGFKAYGFTPVIYSDTEREVGVWRDGKPLYQKVVNYGTLPNASGSVNKAHNILNVDNIFISGGYFVETNGSDKYYYPLVLASGSNEYNIYTRADKTNIRVSVNRDRSSMSAIVVVQYTKTTDTAGSGKYTTLGTPTVHYSTDEQVIGMWIDGKTLYQKTIDVAPLPNNTDKRVAHGISNLDKFISAVGYAISPNVNSIPLPFVNATSASAQVGIITDTSDVIIRARDDRSSYTDAYVTLQYTKTS